MEKLNVADYEIHVKIYVEGDLEQCEAARERAIARGYAVDEDLGHAEDSGVLTFTIGDRKDLIKLESFLSEGEV